MSEDLPPPYERLPSTSPARVVLSPRPPTQAPSPRNPTQAPAPRHPAQAVPTTTKQRVQRGSVLQSWHEVIKILTHPALVLTVTSASITSRDKQFTIYDVDGNIVAYMEIDRSKFSGRFVPGSAFSLRVVDPYGILLLLISRPYSVTRPRLDVSVPDPHTGKHVKIGSSHEVFHLFKRRYDLFTESRNAQFGRIFVQLRAKSSPVENNDGVVVASLDKQWQGVCDELSSHPNKYVIRMDQSTFSMTERRDMRIGASFSLDQRAVLLATAIAIDVDYFTPRRNIVGANAGIDVGVMTAMMAGSSGGTFC